MGSTTLRITAKLVILLVQPAKVEGRLSALAVKPMPHSLYRQDLALVMDGSIQHLPLPTVFLVMGHAKRVQMERHLTVPRAFRMHY